MSEKSISGFPNPFSPKKVKDSEAYGLAFAKAMDKAGRNQYFNSRNDKFEKVTLFARGEQPSTPYLDWLNIDGKSPYVYLDFTPSPIAKKLIDTVVSKYMGIEEEIRATSIDIGSIQQKDQEARDARFRMENKEGIAGLEAMAGEKFEDEGAFTPDTEEELNLWKETMLRTREEIIIETALSLIFNDNDIKEVKRKVLWDLCVKGISATRTFLDANNRIRFRDVNIRNLIYSFSNKNDFKDLAWAGEYVPMKISEVRQRWSKKFTEEQLFRLAQSNRGRYGNPSNYLGQNADPYGMYQYDDFSVMVLDLSMKTTVEKIYQHKVRQGREFIDRVDKEFKETDNKKMISEYDQVVYSGYWIIGTDYIMDWGIAKNLLKPNSRPKDVFLPYVIYMYDNIEMKNKSMLEMAVPMIRQLDLTYLKIQQVVAKARPAGYRIDITALEDIDLGLGDSLSPLELQEISDQTGNVYYRSRNIDGEPLNVDPIAPIVSDIMNNITALMNVWNFHFQRLREYIGLNEYVDSSSINPRVGARVVENQVKASNNAIRYIYDAFENIIERTAGLCAIQFWDQIIFGDPDYIKVIGDDNARFIRDNKGNLGEVDFNIKFDAITNEEESQQLEADIQIALSTGAIDIRDAREIRRIKNLKLASIFMEISREKKRKRDIEDANQKSKFNADAQATAGQQVAEAKLQSEAAKKETLVAVEEAKGINNKFLFIQKVVQDSVNSGQPIPDYLVGIVEQFLSEIFPPPAQQAQLGEVPQGEGQAQNEDALSQDGDLIVLDGEVVYEPKAGEIIYQETPSGAEVTPDGQLVIPVEGREQYLAMSPEERIELEKSILLDSEPVME